MSNLDMSNYSRPRFGILGYSNVIGLGNHMVVGDDAVATECDTASERQDSSVSTDRLDRHDRRRDLGEKSLGSRLPLWLLTRRNGGTQSGQKQDCRSRYAHD